MTPLWWTWAIFALALIALYVAGGQAVKGTPWGVLVDERGRCSLARFHSVWWSIIILPLIAGVAGVRSFVAGTDILGFSIPPEVQGLLVVAGATTVTASAVKAYQDSHHQKRVAASAIGYARLVQIITVDEGAGADGTVDVGKAQSLAVTILLGLAYVATAIHTYVGLGPPPAVSGPQDVKALPGLDSTFITLFAISSAAYVGVKMIPRSGIPTLSLADVRSAEGRLREKEAALGLPMDPRSILARRLVTREQETEALDALEEAARPPGAKVRPSDL